MTGKIIGAALGGAWIGLMASLSTSPFSLTDVGIDVGVSYFVGACIMAWLMKGRRNG